jgi:hypothetical protein
VASDNEKSQAESQVKSLAGTQVGAEAEKRTRRQCTPIWTKVSSRIWTLP